MLARIVTLTISPVHKSEFVQLFDDTAQSIRSCDGCMHLELWQDISYPNVFQTYSLWRDESSLDSYRNSDLFLTTWKKTKAMFAGPPVARSFTKTRVVS